MSEPEPALTPAAPLDPKELAAIARAAAEDERVDAMASAEVKAEAVETFAKFVMAGKAEDGSEDEAIIFNAGRCAVRLMDRSVFTGTLVVTSYRLAFLTAQLPDDLIGVSLMGIVNDGIIKKQDILMANGQQLRVPTLRVVGKDVQMMDFVFDSDFISLVDSKVNGTESRELEAKLRESISDVEKKVRSRPPTQLPP